MNLFRPAFPTWTGQRGEHGRSPAHGMTAHDGRIDLQQIQQSNQIFRHLLIRHGIRVFAEPVISSVVGDQASAGVSVETFTKGGPALKRQTGLNS